MKNLVQLLVGNTVVSSRGQFLLVEDKTFTQYVAFQQLFFSLKPTFTVTFTEIFYFSLIFPEKIRVLRNVILVSRGMGWDTRTTSDFTEALELSSEYRKPQIIQTHMRGKQVISLRISIY